MRRYTCTRGRSDVLIQLRDLIILLEFADKSGDVERLNAEGRAQLQDREYTKGYEGYRVT